MLYFIVPFKSRVVCNDWGKSCRLLEQTLRSICGQTDDQFKVCVICHELPVLKFDSCKIEYYTVPFSSPVFEGGLDSEDVIFSQRSDKGRKCIFGLSIARKDHAEYIMFVDSDDFISNKISALVHSEHHPNGWFFDCGYRMDESLRWIVYPRRRFNHECGSSYVLKTEKAPFPEILDYSLGFDDYYIRRYEVHAYIEECFRKEGCPLAVLPFPGAIYLFNDQSIFSSKLRKKDSGLRTVLRFLLKGKFVGRGMKSEFGLTKETAGEC